MIAKTFVRFAAVTIAALGAASLGGCGGAVAQDDAALEIDDSHQALTAGPDPGAPGDDADDGEKSDCNEHDRGGHKNHHKHKFKVLDALDGAKDHVIVIASLPAGLPDRLIAKLHTIDSNGDGSVTKDELKASLKRHKHKWHRSDWRDGEHDGDDDRDGEHED